MTIMTNARRKNMPPISPGEIVIDNIDFKDVRMINKASKIPMNHFEGLTKSWSSFCSYFVVTTSSTEKIRPIISASSISVADSLKYGKTNINAPVDIITGGINIFLTDKGLFEAFCRTNMTPMPIKTAMIDASVNKSISISIFNVSYLLKILGNHQIMAVTK